MTWTLDKNRPLCPQICEQVCVRIATGEFLPNSRILSVREMAIAAGVNPNTAQRAFETLERDGILYSLRGSGWFVCEDTTKTNEVLQKIITEKTANYFHELNALGLDTEAVKKYIKEWKE